MVVVVFVKFVKELCDKIGVGMMDCKKVLVVIEGDVNKVVEWFCQKGIVSVEKKFGCIVVEGVIGSYIYIGVCVGVLVEVNCEIDFVVWGDMFQLLLCDVFMQVVVCFNVEYVIIDEIFDEICEWEKVIEMGCDDFEGKFEQMKEKIVEGCIGKWFKEFVFMEQFFIKDSFIIVVDFVK